MNISVSKKKLLLCETHSVVGEVIAIRVGHNLQEDVHIVEDGGESRVTAVISHNLNVKDTSSSTEDQWSEAAETVRGNKKQP